jgi:hypothetical protein
VNLQLRSVPELAVWLIKAPKLATKPLRYDSLIHLRRGIGLDLLRHTRDRPWGRQDTSCE